MSYLKRLNIAGYRVEVDYDYVQLEKTLELVSWTAYNDAGVEAQIKSADASEEIEMEVKAFLDEELDFEWQRYEDDIRINEEDSKWRDWDNQLMGNLK